MLLEVLLIDILRKRKKVKILKEVFNNNIKSSYMYFLKNFPLVLFPKMNTFMKNVELTSGLTEVLNWDHNVGKTRGESYFVFLRFMVLSQRKQ